MIADSKLGITIKYNSEMYNDSTMAKIGELYKENLLKIKLLKMLKKFLHHGVSITII